MTTDDATKETERLKDTAQGLLDELTAHLDDLEALTEERRRTLWAPDKK